jgi:hypothetical protein
MTVENEAHSTQVVRRKHATRRVVAGRATEQRQPISSTELRHAHYVATVVNGLDGDAAL